MTCEHEWQDSGGCSENPGVFDNGNGGMVYVKRCTICGMMRKRGKDYTGWRSGNTWGPYYYLPDGSSCGRDGLLVWSGRAKA